MLYNLPHKLVYKKTYKRLCNYSVKGSFCCKKKTY